MKGNIIEAIVGGIVLVVASFFIFFACTTNIGKIGDGYVIISRFDDTSGLFVGSDVKISGIKIGIVKSLDIDENYMARTEILIKNGIKIPVDSSLSITSDGLMGQKYISITPGDSDSFAKSNESMDNTKSSINLENLLNKFLFNGKSS